MKAVKEDWYMFIIGVAGQAQFGKDTLADRLADRLNKSSLIWNRTAFAKNVKRVYAETFGVDFEFIEKWKTNPQPPPGFDMSVRQSLQFIGDGFRKIKEEIWIDLCFRDQTPQIISDVRYPNEFKRIKKEGGCNILIGRSDKLSNDPNGSESLIRPYVEWALNNLQGDFVDLADVLKCDNLQGYPEFFSMFDLFIRNDGSMEALLQTVDEKVVPFVENFVFDFIEGQEELCHTLS